MAENTGISWTDATFNPWIGCTKVGPGCDHCYAERQNAHRAWTPGWGPGVPRKRTSHNNWRKVEVWNAHPERLIGDQWPRRKPRVFAASLADIFDNEVDLVWRAEFFALVKSTPNLQWLIVTKRIGNVADMLPADWGPAYSHVVLLITVINQPEVDRDGPKLGRLGAEFPWLRLGLSIEPMLGPMDLERGGFTFLRDLKSPTGQKYAGVDWVICGGESGAGARPMSPVWARQLRDQCAESGVPFHFKQWGEFAPAEEFYQGDVVRVGKKRAGREIDGTEHNGFPV